MPKKSTERLQEESLLRENFANRLRLAKTARGMSNTDIMEKAERLGQPMRKSKVSQFLHGRFLPTNKRVFLWARILRVDPLWLSGSGSDDDMPLIKTIEEDNEDIQELLQLFASMSSVQKRLLMQIAKQFRFPYVNDTYMLDTKLTKDTSDKK